MPDPDQPPPPDDLLREVSRDEVERLLNQAETLAGEIASEVGLQPSADAEPPAVQLAPGGANDTLEAVEQAAHQAAEVESLLAGGVSERTPQVEVSVEEPRSAGEKPDAIAESPAPEGAPPAERPIAASAQEPAVADSADAESADRSPAVEPKRRGPARWIAAAKSGSRAVVGAGHNLPLRLLILMDWPFARWSPMAKRLLGGAAIVTVVMGLASHVLPRLLENNPYEGLTPYVETQAAPQEHAEH